MYHWLCQAGKNLQVVSRPRNYRPYHGRGITGRITVVELQVVSRPADLVPLAVAADIAAFSGVDDLFSHCPVKCRVGHHISFSKIAESEDGPVISVNLFPGRAYAVLIIGAGETYGIPGTGQADIRVIFLQTAQETGKVFRESIRVSLPLKKGKAQPVVRVKKYTRLYRRSRGIRACCRYSLFVL